MRTVWHRIATSIILNMCNLLGALCRDNHDRSVTKEFTKPNNLGSHCWHIAARMQIATIENSSPQYVISHTHFAMLKITNTKTRTPSLVKLVCTFNDRAQRITKKFETNTWSDLGTARSETNRLIDILLPPYDEYKNHKCGYKISGGRAHYWQKRCRSRTSQKYM